jgi:hypothetical protein
MSTTSAILDAVCLELPCPRCGQSYRVPLKVIGLSQQMLHEGCPVSEERECPPVFYGPLLDPALLDELQAVWTRLESQALAAGGRVVIRG